MATDEETELMSQLLLKGATMLAQHCNECGNPMFRFRGETFCPVCNRNEAERKNKQVEEKMKGTLTQEEMEDISGDSVETGEESIDASDNQEVEEDKTEGKGRREARSHTQKGRANTHDQARSIHTSLSNLAQRLAQEAEEERDISRLNEKLDSLERTLDLIERLEGRRQS